MTSNMKQYFDLVYENFLQGDNYYNVTVENVTNTISVGVRPIPVMFCKAFEYTIEHHL